MMHKHLARRSDAPKPAAQDQVCGIPLDSEYFDDSSVVAAPALGEGVSLASFELPPQYCGVLEYFAQFTDEYGQNPSRIRTPGLQWLILVNRRPLYPYINLEHIVNPWGNGSFQVAIRLDENAVVEFVVRRVRNGVSGITEVGGRIVGRYWYNTIYGDVV